MPTTARGIRSPSLTDTANLHRDFGYMADDVEAWLARTRSYAAVVNAANVPSGTTLATIVIPAQPLACRIMLCFSGLIGYEGGGVDYAANVTASAGTLISTMSGANVAPAAGKWEAYVYEAALTLAVSTATTLTLGLYASSGNAYVRGMFTAEIKFAGEFA